MYIYIYTHTCTHTQTHTHTHTQQMRTLIRHQFAPVRANPSQLLPKLRSTHPPTPPTTTTTTTTTLPPPHTTVDTHHPQVSVLSANAFESNRKKKMM